MTEPKEIQEGLWTFPIVLPDCPLKWLNCYVIKGGSRGRSLLVDTGFRRRECLEALLEGMEALELGPENTDVYLTHMHADHTGNASVLYERGFRIFMGESDYQLLTGAFGQFLSGHIDRYRREGVDDGLLRELYGVEPKPIYGTGQFKARQLREGDVLRYGGYELQCVLTPGHTPGHMCLYDSGKKLMLTGDHILFDITPNICAWPGMKNSLGAYLDSLAKVRALEPEIALPAHRTMGETTVQARIDQLIRHHFDRLAEIEGLIRDAGRLNAFQVAGRTLWHINSGDWDSFPLPQKNFAIGETLAHLDYLVDAGRLLRDVDGDGRVTYLGA